MLNPFIIWRCQNAPIIYRVCQCIETRKTAKESSKWMASRKKMPEKKRNQLVKTICDKKVVTSTNWPQLEDECWQVFSSVMISRIVREVAVRQLKRIGHPIESLLGQSWPGNRGKRRNVGRTRVNTFEHHWHRDGPSCCPVTSSYRGCSLGCPQAGGCRTREAGTPKWRW